MVWLQALATFTMIPKIMFLNPEDKQ